MALDGHGILCEDGGSVLTGSDAPVLRQNMRPHLFRHGWGTRGPPWRPGRVREGGEKEGSLGS